MKKIIACGCSWTHGFYWKDREHKVFDTFKNYPSLYGEKHGYDVINLSLPGASTYAIAKQVEYAISLQPDLVMFNTTTNDRIDLKKSADIVFDNYVPSFKDFLYGIFANKHTAMCNDNIETGSFSTFLPNLSPLKNINDKNKNAIAKFIVMYDQYIDSAMRRDQNRLLVIGILSLLKYSGIPYVCVDLIDIVSADYIEPVIKIHCDELIRKFPVASDSLHFNQDGHAYITDQLENFVKSNIKL